MKECQECKMETSIWPNNYISVQAKIYRLYYSNGPIGAKHDYGIHA